MHRPTLVLLVAAAVILCVGALLVPQWLSDDPTLLRWSEADEVEVAVVDEAAVETVGADAVDRTIVAANDGSDPDGRVNVLLRGRVIDKFQRPVAAAKVWLDFGRAGQRGGPATRQRRVLEPVQTDDEGRFAFQGQTFRNLQVSLQVRHSAFAPGLFDKFVGEVAQRASGEVELGDLVLARGGDVVGRVTDLEGNGVAAAKVVLQPENGNRMRFLRDRDELLPAFTTDNNGWFRRANVAAGDWSVTVTAKRHTEGRSPVFANEDEQTVELEDIRLGPGYEVTGWVRSAQGGPIAKAEVVLRGEARDRQNRGERGGDRPDRGDMAARFFGRDHRAVTDAEGRFFVEHLPATPMTLDAHADTYLDAKLANVDPSLEQPLVVTMQEGLRITGVAIDEDGSPVLSFAVRAIRVRGLDNPAAAPPSDNPGRAGAETAMREMRAQWEEVRQRGDRDARGPGGQRPGQFARDLGKPEARPRGEFLLTGLQEGVYEVHLQSADHARHRSAAIELRTGFAAPHVTATLDRGVFVAGVVNDSAGSPVREARVTLRPSSLEATPTDDAQRRRGRGGLEELARRFGDAVSSIDATTDAEGAFVLKHVPRGVYRLDAGADGFADASSDTFELTGDRSGVALTLGALGGIAGKVLGLATNELDQARIGAMPMARDGRSGGAFRGGAGFREAGVGPDGTYRLEDLEPGEYVVRSWIGSPQELMRELMPKFFDGSLTADAVVRPNEVTDLVVSVTRPQVGTVAGSVLHNGASASGFRVELTRVDPTNPTNANGTPATAGERPNRAGGPGGRAFANFARTQQATVDASGQFRIASVPAGTYRLRVSTGVRGGTLHEDTVEVVTNATTDRSISLATQSLQGSVTPDAGTDAAALEGVAQLFAGATELPENPASLRRDNRVFDARVRGGAFRFDTLPAGSHLLSVTIRGRERSVQSITVGAGSTKEVTVPIGKVAAAAPETRTPRAATPQPR